MLARARRNYAPSLARERAVSRARCLTRPPCDGGGSFQSLPAGGSETAADKSHWTFPSSQSWGNSVCEREREIMVLMGSRRLLLLFCLFTVVARRVAGQGAVARLLPCGVDNLSCPNTDQSILECYPFTQLCDTIEQCDGGSDEGTDLVALECECPFSRARKHNRAT